MTSSRMFSLLCKLEFTGIYPRIDDSVLTFEKYRFPGVELDTTSVSILSLRRVLLDRSTPPSLLCKRFIIK